jgi:hypothetical protein
MNVVITKSNLEKLGWRVQEDRDMAENGGHLFVHPNLSDIELRLWNIFPRMNISHGKRIVFDTMDIFF